MGDVFQVFQHGIVQFTFGIDDHVTDIRIGLQVFGRNIDALGSEKVIHLTEYAGNVFMDVEKALFGRVGLKGDLYKIHGADS